MNTPKRYFGGSKVSPAVIHQLEAENFKEFVERYFNVPVRFPMTRKDFMAHPDRDKLKDGPHICACSFKEGTTRRNNNNGDQLNAVILDLDEGDFIRTLAAAPEAMAEKLYPYNFVCWHTAKSVPEAPRLKLLVDVKTCGVENIRRLVHFVTDRIGVPRDFKGITESTTLSQAHYRPLQFHGEEFTAILCSRTSGLELDVADLPKDTAESGRVYGYEGEEDSEGWGLAYLPLAELTVADVEPALRTIDPDIDRPQWCEIAASLRHQFRDEEQAREAFELYEDWSSGGEKYVEGDPFTTWKSFRPDATGKAPVTIRTLFFHAIKAGWNPKPVSDKFQQSIEAWIEEQTDQSVLMTEGCQRISALPFANAALEDLLNCVLRARLKKITGHSISKLAIQKQVATARHQKREAEADGEAPNWLRPFCYISTENMFRNIATGVQLTPEAFNNTFSEKLMPKDSESEATKRGRPAISPADFALNLVRIKRVDATVYSPLHGASAEPFIKLNGRDYLNTYMPSSLPMEDPENSEAAGELFKSHFAVLIAEPEYQEQVINYLCHIVQFPGKKMRWLPLIQSAEGVGKGFLGKIMMAVLGKPNVKVISPEVLKSQWNDWAVGSVLSILDEIHIPGQNREMVMNSLKMPISDDHVTVNKRNTHATDWPNYTNYIGFTNFPNAIHLKPSDRRWMIIRSGLQTKRQVEQLEASGHFNKRDILLGKWAGALRHWMMNRKLPKGFSSNSTAPHTKYRAAVVQASKNPLLVKIEQLIDDTDYPMIGEDVIALNYLNSLTEYEARNNAKVETYLSVNGYYLYENGKVFNIKGMKTQIWVHQENYVEGVVSAEEILSGRCENNL